MLDMLLRMRRMAGVMRVRYHDEPGNGVQSYLDVVMLVHAFCSAGSAPAGAQSAGAYPASAGWPRMRLLRCTQHGQVMNESQ